MRRFLVLLLSCSLVSCVSRRLEIEALDLRAPVTVSTPVKAHLTDGSTVVYPEGVTVTSDALVGNGTRYDLTLATESPVERLPLADIVGLESYSTRVNLTATVLGSTLGPIATAAGAIVLAVAIFGSCPTVYSAGGVEEAELFSSSIAPLFEGRDIDRLRATADAAGIVSLEVRNEAMETHYINHLQVLEVSHADDELVVPDAHGAPLVVRRPAAPASVTSRDGRDLRETLARSDGRFYLTDRKRVDAATAADMLDWVDVTVPVESGAKSAALVFRMRNSLLNTILLYDVMLAPAGAAAIDWMGEDLAEISTAVELGRWHQARAGMHISVWQDGAYREVARIPDSGPISWHAAAAVVPVPAGASQLRLRLSYLADHWRIDSLGVSFQHRAAAPRSIPPSSVQVRSGASDPEALANIRESDESYLQTNPGQAFVARFDAGADAPGKARTFLLSSQGYYTEWIRGAWVRNATVAQPFRPSDEAILTAMRKWGAERDAFERRFFHARVAVQ